MQIDFHHGATYVVSRLAGMTHEQAEIIAYSAQYVDDATNDGYIKFDNGATYGRIATAHKMLDYSNFKELANHRAWVPFHFLPGNDGKAANENLDKRFIYKMICKPGSHVAKDMVRDAILEKHRPYALQRLGITMHVYKDTWSHYGFCGTTHAINRADDIKIIETNGHTVEKEDVNIKSKLKNFFKDAFDNATSSFVSDVNPLGHGSVLGYPDKPYLNWKYTNGLGEIITRDNPKDFLEAVRSVYEAVSRYRLGNPDAVIPPINNSDLQKIAGLISSLTDEDGEKRHQIWLAHIKNGYFSFGKQDVTYIAKGEGSWKHYALGTDKMVDDPGEVFKYKDSFLTSNWKMFHDAALAHRYNVLHNILPRYGICVG